MHIFICLLLIIGIILIITLIKNTHIENFKSCYNVLYTANNNEINKPYGHYRNAPTHIFFDKNGKYLTTLDMLPSLNSINELNQIECPNMNLQNDRFNDPILCWQKK